MLSEPVKTRLSALSFLCSRSSNWVIQGIEAADYPTGRFRNVFRFLSSKIRESCAREKPVAYFVNLLSPSFRPKFGKTSAERKVSMSSAYCKLPKSGPLCAQSSGVRCSRVDHPIQCMVLLILGPMHAWLKILIRLSSRCW
jgi:hypothetical protein